MRFDLTDFERRVIEPLLPNKPREVARVDGRRAAACKDQDDLVMVLSEGQMSNKGAAFVFSPCRRLASCSATSLRRQLVSPG